MSSEQFPDSQEQEAVQNKTLTENLNPQQAFFNFHSCLMHICQNVVQRVHLFKQLCVIVAEQQ